MKINKVIINIGNKEFHAHEIAKDLNLTGVVNRAIVFKGIATLVDKINEENATLYIMSDSEYSVRTIDLINASEELHNEFWRKTK